MEDFDIAPNKIGESGQRLAERAVEEARRREHAVVGNEHLLVAFAQSEWDLFAQVMRDFDLNPHAILHAAETELARQPRIDTRDLRVSPASKLVFKLAHHHATRAGRQALESTDLFAALFEDSQGVPAAIMRKAGIEPESLVSRITARVRDIERDDERLKKQFELPPFLKHFATNLNLLARQDRLPPVFGRVHEIQQAVEILSHRERANSVMLIGEPGVGKTAIAEGLARRIEFEAESLPARLRDCQVVSLQLNSLVAGTMLRGMFEDRIQNVLRELKERPNLILFIDEAHTLIGAGSALGAPADAANVLKGVLARGEVRIIGATTLSEYKEFIQEDEALARRFRTVFVAEPSIDETRRILQHVRPRLERNYGVKVDDEAIEMALQMSPRYQRHLRLPDKAIGWLDTASVRAEIDRRPEVRASDVVSVISQTARIPEDMVFRDVTDRFRDIEVTLAQRIIGQYRRRACGRRAADAQQGPAQGRLRSPGRRAAVPRPDRRRQDRAGEGRRRVPVRRREEDGPHRHVRISGRCRGGGQADWHAARHRRIGARRRADESAARQPVHGDPARRDREGEPVDAERVPAGLRRGLDHGWPRQARLPERRHRHHDVEPRRRALPQADEPVRVPHGEDQHCRTSSAR